MERMVVQLPLVGKFPTDVVVEESAFGWSFDQLAMDGRWHIGITIDSSVAELKPKDLCVFIEGDPRKSCRPNSRNEHERLRSI